jgi:hypothetical protein
VEKLSNSVTLSPGAEALYCDLPAWIFKSIAEAQTDENVARAVRFQEWWFSPHPAKAVDARKAPDAKTAAKRAPENERAQPAKEQWVGVICRDGDNEILFSKTVGYEGPKIAPLILYVESGKIMLPSEALYVTRPS